MPFIPLGDGRRVLWEPTTELICTYCRKDIDIPALARKAIDSTNFMFDLRDNDGLKRGEYWYFHKQCSNIEDGLLREGAKIAWGWHDMKSVLGLDSPLWKQVCGNVQKYLKKELPAGGYDRLYAQWLPAIKPPVRLKLGKDIWIARHKQATAHQQETATLAVPQVQTPRPTNPEIVISRRIPKLQRSLQPGHVYIIHAQGTSRVKIGRTTSTAYRFESLQTASPFPLLMLRSIPTADAVGLENTLHKRYAAYRQHREWFDLPADVLTALLQEDFA